MKLKSIIDSPCALRHCFEKLPIQSGFSRRHLLEKEMMVSGEEISNCYAELSSCIGGDYDTLQYKLHSLKDISGTISRIALKLPLDDIEFFEVKNLAILSCEIRDIVSDLKLDIKPPCDLEGVIDILDPDKLRIASFYIYDSYSKELVILRNKAKGALSIEAKEDLLSEISSLEDGVRKKLSLELFPFANSLSEAQNRIADIDILVAKAIVAGNSALSIPSLSKDGITRYKDLFHPQVAEMVEERGDKYQKVDISFGEKPTLIVGANMGGKTVILKSLALCQYLFSFGFPIPAKSSEIAVKSGVFFSTGDAQSEKDGLSSFGGEMKSIDKMLKWVKTGDSAAIFIDEPARSTNPIEGTALVESLITIFGRYNASPVITTHYNIDIEGCNRLKVKGMESGRMNYAITEAPLGSLPKEAIAVAKSLEIDNEWLEEAERILNDKQ